MAGITVASKLLKVTYRDMRARLMAYEKNPLLGMLPKKRNFVGKTYNFAVWDKPGSNRSASFAAAQTNEVADAEAEFALTRTSNYGVHSISAEALKASEGNEAAFVSGRRQLIDSTVYKLSRDVANDCFRDGSGTRGRISSTVALSASQITLADRNDVVHFERGMRIVIAPTGTPFAALRSSGTATTITAVNRNTGVLTADMSAIADAQGDYVIAEGDAANGGATVKPSGLDAWLPAADPGATAFFGVDRSVDPQRLGGIRYDGSSQSVEEALIDAGALCYEAGAEPSIALVNPTHMAELAKSVQQKATYDVKAFDADVYYGSITVITGCGPVKVVMDPNCPRGVAYMLDLSTWELVSLGEVPHMADEDGLTILRAASADAYEIRFRSWAQLGCHFPGANARVTLAT